MLVAAPSGNGPISLSGCGNPQRLKQLGDELLDTTVAMSTTRDAVNRLIEGNMHYLLAAGVEDEASTNESENDVYHRLMEHMRELDWLMQQTDGLRQKLLGTSQLVSYQVRNSCLKATLITPTGFQSHGFRQRSLLGRPW